MTNSSYCIHADGLRFAYSGGPPVLDIEELVVASGERVFLYGPSGSGKTTLLGLVAGVLSPPPGTLHVLGHDVGALSSSARDRLRAAHIGYVFQMFNLIPYLDVRDNIALPVRITTERRRRVDGPVDQAVVAAAAQLGIEELLDEKVTRLSVGQQQRVAAARALLGAPELIIADEPTSALDTDRRHAFLELLFKSVEEAGSTLLFVSHDLTLADLFDRSVSLAELNDRVSA
ncbi:MAG: ABC transporter ATP-binding protein [Gemmatimonadetes bacterium]|nr:ABC transporter ATP-binding protein [Gemmatimonadota bacterium]